MTPGLRRPPAPPHDPYSILLNGAIGFRQIAPAAPALPAAIDAECCALTLPRLPASLRDLAEPTGSLGGVRPPSNVALGPDGSVYLLDRTHLHLKRFDPCACRFTTVPCFGGEGHGPRELRNPGDIAIACGNLYVCDTGVETAPHAGENHRVSVFALKGFALRGHLVPPAKKLPWRPASVAVDSLGRVWVGDLAGNLHRFAPSGAWEQSWPMIPAPAHLAIDGRDRVYVVAPGTPSPLRVFDADVKPLADPPATVAQVRAAFRRLPFEVDAQGDLELEPCCDPVAVTKADPRTDLVFDADGNPRERARPAPAALYERSATYRSEPLDSHIAQCVWHRVVLYGTLPPGTRVTVRARCADERAIDPQPDPLHVFVACAVADTFDADGRWDCLVRGEPGRHLWLELTLEGNGAATPAVHAIVIEFPRVSLRRFLPAVFGMDPVSADFTDRFLALFDTSLRSIEQRIDGMASLFDPGSTPATTTDPRQLDFLSWLGSWIGVAIDRNWDIPTRRRFVKRAGALFDRRGTVGGLREALLLLLDFDRHAACAVETRAPGRCMPAPLNCAPEPAPPSYEPPPLVLEHFRLRRWLRLGAGRLGDDAVVWGERIVGRTRLGANAQAGVTRLDASPRPDEDPFLVHANQFSVFVPARCSTTDRTRRALENLLKADSPAGTRGQLHFVEPRFRIGIQSMLGFDAVVAALPQGVTLGTTPLGAASILTTPPHLQGGPAIAVGKEGRIGTTMRLA
jgi:phage tail-like protein